jgi:hypothetical protein
LALAAGQGATAAVTASNAYVKFLAQNDAMTEAKCLKPAVTVSCPATYSLLKQDATFRLACDTAYADLKKGIIGQVDGVTLVKVP